MLKPTLLTLICLLACLTSFLASCATPVSPPTISAASLPERTPLRYSFRPMAFDGEKLWQLIYEPNKLRLAPQTLQGQSLREIPLQDQTLPEHISQSWGQDSLWLLDRQQTLRRIDKDGKTLSTLKLSEFTQPGGLEQITWVGEQLWVLHRSYLAPTGQSIPARFYQLDPQTGKSLAQIEVKDPNFNFAHTNLTGDSSAFYVARGHIFDHKLNLVYRVDRQTAQVSTQALGRLYTGLTSSFIYQGQLFGIEMIDIDSCGEFCRGQFIKLPQPNK